MCARMRVRVRACVCACMCVCACARACVCMSGVWPRPVALTCVTSLLGLSRRAMLSVWTPCPPSRRPAPTPECGPGWERLREGKADLGESCSPAEPQHSWLQGPGGIGSRPAACLRGPPGMSPAACKAPARPPLGCSCWWTQCRGAVTGTGSEAGVPAFKSDPSSARPPSLLSSSSVKWAP